MRFHYINTERPVLLLNIDGVLSPLNATKPDGWDDFLPLRIGDSPLWLSESMGRALASLDATVMWCSTWCDDPHEIVEIARYLGGLSPLWNGLWGSNFGSKSDMVQAAMEMFPLVVWVDDAEPMITDAPENLVRITPDPALGLQRGDIAEVDAYLTAWRHTHHLSVRGA